MLHERLSVLPFLERKQFKRLWLSENEEAQINQCVLNRSMWRKKLWKMVPVRKKRPITYIFLKQTNSICTNQQPPQRSSAVPDTVWLMSKWLLAFPRVPVTPGTALAQTIFSPCCPLNDRSAARSFHKIGRLPFSPHSFPTSDERQHSSQPWPRLSLFSVHWNVTWWGRSVQCNICSKWVNLKCSLLSFSKFRSLGSSHYDFFLGLLQLVYLHCSIGSFWAPC